MKFKSFDDIYKKDEDKSKHGVPVEVGFNEKDEAITLIVSDLNHPDAQKVHRKYEKAFENSRHIPKKRQLVWARYLAEAVVKDWTGVIDDKGKKIPCTQENVVKAFLQYEDLFSDILRFADDRENFRPKEIDTLPEEDTEKN